ncbi:unnamed protein product [Eruca vesicaria subsp. sativa]|uniref:Uncharacterized protein n=1 Tax=Eruca vesicaria subsp. sativa TaxID=29727 RepID=A0ABC8LF39_ERUVS|nr:unnamed protein product [Eruca vesicaria subsp. sativa]
MTSVTIFGSSKRHQNFLLGLMTSKKRLMEYLRMMEYQGNDEQGSKTDEDGPKNDKEDGSDEEFQTPRGTANTNSDGRKGKKRLPDRGMEKRKQKVLCSSAKQTPFNEGMKSFVAQLFQQNFSAMEERLEKQMGERFEKLQSELRGSVKDSTVDATVDATEDEIMSEAEDMDIGIGTQGLEDLSQASNVPEPTNKVVLRPAPSKPLN